MNTPLNDPDTHPDHKTYLEQKSDGGTDGRDGTEFEVRAAAFEIIKLAHDVLAKKVDPTKVTITWQARGMYLDDVLIDIHDTSLHHYEMKTGNNEYWGKAEKSLLWCIEQQRNFNLRHSYHATYNLVLSGELSYHRLHPSRPDWIEVPFFPNSTNPTTIETRVPGFIESVIMLLPAARQGDLLSKLSAPHHRYLEFDQNDVIFLYKRFQAAFQGLCFEHPEKLDLILSDVSNSTTGMFSYRRRGFGHGVQEILDRAAGIRFVVCEGVVFFECDDGTQGRAPIELGSPAGAVFESLVLSGHLSTAEELREHMELLLEGEDEQQ